MEVLAFLIPFVLLGGAVVFIAFSGGPGAAREAYLTRGSGVFRVTVTVILVAFGLAVPALVIADRDEGVGATGGLQDKELGETAEEGKTLFRQQCASCHSLAAVNARGVTGPNLDRIGEITPDRIIEAIKNGGTGQGRMPAGLLEGEEAEAVAEYVAAVAGRD